MEKYYDPLENSPFGKFCLISIASSLPWIVGFHFSIVNPIANTVLQVTYNDTYMIREGTPLPETIWVTLLTFSASIIIVGGFIGGVTTRFWVQRYSAKRTMQLAHAINISAILIIALGAGLSGSYEAFIIGRFLSGYPCGICYVIIPAMIAEMSEPSHQGVWQGVFGMMLSMGLFMGSILAHPNVLGSITLWPVLFSLGIVPSIIALIISTKLPPSHHLLLREGKKAQALKVLKKLRTGNEEAIAKELEEVEKELSASETSLGIKTILSVRQYRNQFLGVLVLLSNLMLVGVNNIVLYSTLVFTEAGISDKHAAYATIGVFGLQFVAACIGPKLVHKLGGLRMCIGANAILICSLVLFILTKALSNLSNVFPYLSIAAVAIFMVAWAGGTNIATFGVMGVITTQPTRMTCFSYANIALWATSFLVGFLPPYLQIGLKDFAMAPWVVFATLFLIYMIFYIPTIKGKTPEEIQAKLGARTSSLSMQPTKPLQEL